MKTVIALLSLMIATPAFAGDLASCQTVADKFAQATHDSYENPAYLIITKAYEDGAELVYKYAFDYAVPYNDEGRATMISATIAIRLFVRECGLRKLELLPVE